MFLQNEYTRQMPWWGAFYQKPIHLENVVKKKNKPEILINNGRLKNIKRKKIRFFFGFFLSSRTLHTKDVRRLIIPFYL